MSFLATISALGQGNRRYMYLLGLLRGAIISFALLAFSTSPSLKALQRRSRKLKNWFCQIPFLVNQGDASTTS
jgi:hypothetical protein